MGSNGVIHAIKNITVVAPYEAAHEKRTKTPTTFFAGAY
jgi:hypothetical protein